MKNTLFDSFLHDFKITKKMEMREKLTMSLISTRSSSLRDL